MSSNPGTGPSVNDAAEETFTFRHLVNQWRGNLQYAFRNYWRMIFLASLLCMLLGMAYAWIKHTTYTARLSFVVEESKGSGGSIASALAGQFGFDIGGIGGTSGILAGDNVLELLKSQSLLKKTLLSPYTDSNISLADRYAEVYGLKEKWKNDKEIGKQVSFSPKQNKPSRLEDSLLQSMMKRIGDKELSIGKPDKKLGFFELQVSTRDENLSMLICERLLKISTDFYIDTKTKRLSSNVLRLQRRADSLGVLLDKKTYSSAAANQGLLDANPAYSSPMVTAEISSREKFIQSTVYAEIIKNLEVSKTSLIQETPTVQIVDQPELPLKENKVKMLTAGFVGFMIGLVLSTLLFSTLRKEF